MNCCLLNICLLLPHECGPGDWLAVAGCLLAVAAAGCGCCFAPHQCTMCSNPPQEDPDFSTGRAVNTYGHTLVGFWSLDDHSIRCAAAVPDRNSGQQPVLLWLGPALSQTATRGSSLRSCGCGRRPELKARATQ